MSSAEFARYARDIVRAAAGIESMADAAVMRVARGALETAKDAAPVESGDLRNTLRVVRRRDGSVAVESGVFYAAFQEFGTSQMPPTPFMRPAIDRWGPRLVDEVEGIRDEVVRRLG